MAMLLLGGAQAPPALGSAASSSEQAELKQEPGTGMLHTWVLGTTPCPPRLAPYLQQPLGAVLQDPLQVPQALGGPVAGDRGAGR